MNKAMKNLGQTAVVLFVITLLSASCEEYDELLIRQGSSDGVTEPDSVATDTVVIDTTIRDSVRIDSLPPDSIPIDTIIIDTVVVDSIPTDSVMFGTALLIWSEEYEADGCGFFVDIDSARYKPHNEEFIDDSFKDSLSPNTKVIVEYRKLSIEKAFYCSDLPEGEYNPWIEVFSIRRR